MAGRREGVTHLPLGVTVYPLLHPNQKNQHTCKEEMDTLPNLRQNKQGPHNLDHNMERGGGGLIPRHSGAVCAVLVFDLLAHPPPRDILCCVLCCAYAYAKVWGGGGHICLCMRQVCSFLLVYVYYPSTPPPLWCPLDGTHA